MKLKSNWLVLVCVWPIIILFHQNRMAMSFYSDGIRMNELNSSARVQKLKIVDMNPLELAQTEDDLSPQTSSLEKLKGYADRIQIGQIIDTESSEFQTMLDHLPRGKNLPFTAKRDLHILFIFANNNKIQRLQENLFEIRFGINLESEWSTDKYWQHINTLWIVLRDLPDSNVEGNSSIYEILLGKDEDDSWYKPFTISITSRVLSNQEKFEDMIRREVGHAVLYDQEPWAVGEKNFVNVWLKEKFGWQTFGTTDKEIDAWVKLMGGWKKPNDSEMNESEEWDKLRRSEISEIRKNLQTVLGDGNNWGPSKAPPLPDLHPWHDEKFSPRLVVKESKRDWYKHFKKWHKVNNKAFALNYQDSKFMAVNETTLDLIDQMPSNKAAMSPSKFFGELYALYYDLDDPKRSVISSDIAAWLEENIGTTFIN